MMIQFKIGRREDVARITLQASLLGTIFCLLRKKFELESTCFSEAI